jgi:hypothetical protein
MDFRRRGRPVRVPRYSGVGNEIVGEHIAHWNLLDRDHRAQHLRLTPVVLGLRGIVDGRKSRLALQAICKQLGR